MTRSSQLLHHYLFSTSPQMPPVLAEAASLHTTQLRIETAGLVWIGAELVILYLVLRVNLIVRAHLPHESARPPSTRGPLLILLLGTFAIAALLTLGRYIFVDALPEAIQSIILGNSTDPGHQIHALYMARAHTHLALWCGFITLWVLLEVAIVYAGFKTYRSLRLIFETLPKGSQS